MQLLWASRESLKDIEIKKMNNNLLISLLKQKKSTHNKDVEKYFDYLHFDLSSKIYSYGDHFKNHLEKKNSVNTRLINRLRFINKIKNLFHIKIKSNSSRFILSNAYFNLENLNIGQNWLIISPPWETVKYKTKNNFSLFNKAQKLSSFIKDSDFIKLIDDSFFSKIEDYKTSLKKYVVSNNIYALFIAQDLGFFEKIAIEVFKELGLPTFNFIHGFPAIYNGIDNNRTDYIVVWGNEIKNNFIKNGYPNNKIIVNGHPMYKTINAIKLKFDFDDILIISKSLISSQYSDEVILGDRSNLIYYLLRIKEVLEKFNVKKVRFRPHPSENINWYYKYIDDEFFVPDTESLQKSLTKATLVIGGTSTTFFESLIFGVNYVVYEPIDSRGKLLDGFIPVSPFDGNNLKVPVAKTSQDLFQILENKLTVDNSVLSEYINMDFNQKIILEHIESFFYKKKHDQ